MFERESWDLHGAASVGRPLLATEPARPRPLIDAVLRLIWRERTISRADIARQADLSRSTVSEIVTALLRTGLIAEKGTAPSSGGRRPIVLEFQDDACFILGIELGASHVAVALTDLRGRVLCWEQVSHPVRTDPEGTRARVIELCDACVATRKRGRGRLVGIGVAVPSPVDPRHPDSLSEVVLPEWRGQSGLEVLRTRYRVPILVDNDANLGALAEHWWGAGRAVDDLAYIKLGTGVGSGHVIRGQIYRGSTGVAGEIGHLAIDPQGAPCVCGLRGCLATLVGSPALEARARALLRDYPNSVLGARQPTIESIEDAALKADPLALFLVQEAAGYLGIAVAGMLNLMNPAMVIVGGGLARLGELLLGSLRETVKRQTLVSSLAASEVRTSDLGPQGIPIGAATLILQTALADVRLFPNAVRQLEAR